jgi:hypothetical protein
MIAAALRVFDAVQIHTDAERRWHRVGLWMASFMLLPSGYLMMLGLAAKAPFMGLWASMPFVALASLLYAACRIRGQAIATLSAWAKQEWERCMRTLARLQPRVGTWMCRTASRACDASCQRNSQMALIAQSRDDTGPSIAAALGSRRCAWFNRP